MQGAQLGGSGGRQRLPRGLHPEEGMQVRTSPALAAPSPRLCILPTDSSGAGIQVQITIRHLCYLKSTEGEEYGMGSELLQSHEF